MNFEQRKFSWRHIRNITSTELPTSEDQYKKKFKDWYKKGLLPPKKRQRERIGTGTPKAIKACSSLRNGHVAPWSGSSPEENMISTSADDTDFKREDTQLVHIERQIDNLTVSEQPQQEYILQLNNLWDAHFDAEFGDAKLVDVQAAVESMIQFLVDISATDPDLWKTTTRPGDRGLLHLVSARIWRCYPTDEWLFRGLDYVTSIVPLPIEHEEEWRAFQDRTAMGPGLSDAAQRLHEPEQKSDTGSMFIDSAQDWQKLERRKTNFGDVLMYCVSDPYPSRSWT
jgi:hypothetical protein